MTFADMISKSVKRARESGRTTLQSQTPLKTTIQASPHVTFLATRLLAHTHHGCSRGTLARAHERPRTHRTLGVGDASPMDGRGTLLHRRPHALRRAAGPDGQLQRRPGRADNYEPMLFSSRRLPESFSCDIVSAKIIESLSRALAVRESRGDKHHGSATLT